MKVGLVVARAVEIPLVTTVEIPLVSTVEIPLVTTVEVALVTTVEEPFMTAGVAAVAQSADGIHYTCKTKTFESITTNLCSNCRNTTIVSPQPRQ